METHSEVMHSAWGFGRGKEKIGCCPQNTQGGRSSVSSVCVKPLGVKLPPNGLGSQAISSSVIQWVSFLGTDNPLACVFCILPALRGSRTSSFRVWSPSVMTLPAHVVGGSFWEYTFGPISFYLGFCVKACLAPMSYKLLEHSNSPCLLISSYYFLSFLTLKVALNSWSFNCPSPGFASTLSLAGYWSLSFSKAPIVNATQMKA